MQDVAVGTVYDLGRKFYEEANGITATARVLFLSYLQDHPLVYQKHVARLVEIAVTHLVESAHTQINNIVARAAARAARMEHDTDVEPEHPILARARAAGHRQERKRKADKGARLAKIKALGMRLLEYGLPGGKRLKDATRADLLTAASGLMLKAADQVADAFWLQMVAARLKGGQTVKASGMTWRDLLDLKRDAAAKAAELKK